MRNNEEIVNLVSTIQIQLAVQEEKEKSLRDLITKMAEDIEDLQKDISEIHSMANRWKGGFLVLAGMGGVIGWIASTWSDFFSIFHK